MPAIAADSSILRPDSDDASVRFILPADAPYLANLEVLWAADPALARLIEAVDDAETYPTQPTRSGAPTVAMAGPNGRPVLLHSKYEPVTEAQRLAASLD